MLLIINVSKFVSLIFQLSPMPIHLLIFLCLYEFMWNSYLLSSSSGFLILEYPCADCVPNAFGWRAEFDVEVSHVFPQYLLQLSPW